MQSVDDMRYAVVNRQSRVVVNVIDAPADWKVDTDHRLVPTETGGPYDAYNERTGMFTPAVIPAPEPTARERYAAASTQTEKLGVIAKQLDLEG
jgi:hypothetical protein